MVLLRDKKSGSKGFLEDVRIQRFAWPRTDKETWPSIEIYQLPTA